MVDRICAAPACGNTFEAKRRNSRFCSDVCRAAQGRSERIASGSGRSARQDMSRSIKVPNPPETLDRLLAKRGISADRPSPNLRWHRVDDVTWELRQGRKVVAHVIDRGHFADRPTWTAVCGEAIVGPSMIEDSGLSNGRAGLVDAKRVAEAMATGDVRPLVLFAQGLEDCTDDMRLALSGLLDLIAGARRAT